MTQIKKHLFLLLFTLFFVTGHTQNAPVTYAGNVSSPAPSASIPITVNNFTNIGVLSLTMTYNAAVATATTIVPNPLLGGTFIYNTVTSGSLIISWHNTTGISLANGAVAFTITFLKVSQGSTALQWDNSGISCEYGTFSNGTYPILNDNPTPDYYHNGSLNFIENAPFTSVPDVVACSNTVIEIPVKVSNFNNIGVISLTLDYNPVVLVFQGFTPHASLPDNFIVASGVAGRAVASGYVSTASPGISLSDNTVLFTMSFLYLGGSTDLAWYDNGISCEYSNGSPYFLTCYDSPQSSFYTVGSVSPHSRPTVAVTGTTTINKGQSTDITFALTGTAPWSLTYNAGSTPVTVPVIETSPYVITVSPITTTTYTATALSDAVCAALPANITGPAIVTVKEFPLDIILEKTANCGNFAVKLKPLWPVNGLLTNIIFTVKWPAMAGTDVQLTDITATWPNLSMQGQRELSGGYYYATFIGATSYPVNWLASTENTILTFNNSGNGDGTANFTIIASDYDVLPPGLNTAYYAEYNGTDETNSIINNANGVSVNCGIYLKDFLQGPYQPALHEMSTALNIAGYLPTTQPYATTPLAYAGTESVASFLSTVVDWVVVDIRTGTAATTIVDRKAGLLLKNGNIVSTDQVSPMVFNNLQEGSSYYVVIRHRNHLPVMTASAVAFPNTSLSRIDLTTNPAVNVYGTPEGVIQLETGTYGQVCGDVNMDNKLVYSGNGNDRSLILNKLTSVYNPFFLNNTLLGYYTEDLNMNGVVKYSGTLNDPSIISLNIDYFTDPTFLNSRFLCPVPVVIAKNTEPITNDGPVTISVKPENDYFDIVLKSESALTGGFDNIQFTLGWKNEAGKALQSLSYEGNYNLKPQGEAISQGDWNFQTFVMTNWIELPESFIKGEPLTVLRIKREPGRLNQGLKVAENEESQSYNGAYYVSVLGSNKTGPIRDSETENGHIAHNVLLYPNPVSGNVLNLFISAEDGETAEVGVFDMLSRQVAKYNLAFFAGQDQAAKLDISMLEKGYYTVVIQVSGKQYTGKIVKQ